MATLTLVDNIPQTVRCRKINSITAVLIHNLTSSLAQVQVHIPSIDGPARPANTAIPGLVPTAMPSNFRVVRPGREVTFRSVAGTLDEIILVSVGGAATVDVFDVFTSRL